jgi:nucleoside phosphorylase
VSVREIVDEGGTSLWAGKPLLVPGARTGVLCSAGRVVDDPGERAALAARTGADAVDMESGVLAMSGRLAGAVKAISDAPGRPLGRLAHAVTPAGEVNWPAVAAAFATQPRDSLRAVRGARRGLASLERAAAALAGG